MTILKAKRQGFYNGEFVDVDQTFELNEDIDGGKVPNWAERASDDEFHREARRDSDFRKLAMSAGQANNLGVDTPIFRGEELPANHPQIGVSESDPLDAALDQQGITVKPGAGEPEGPFPVEPEPVKVELVQPKAEPKVEPKAEPAKRGRPAKPAKNEGDDLLG